jgi:hypothetical protein
MNILKYLSIYLVINEESLRYNEHINHVVLYKISVSIWTHF